MTKNASIAIIGAGPAGLTAAVILHKHGHDVKIYEGEASPMLRLQGGSLDLHEDKAQLALRHAGLLDDFRLAARHQDQVNRMIDPVTGMAQSLPPFPGQELDRPEIDRGVLRDLLRAALPEETILWGARLKAVQAGENDVHTLHFCDGRSAKANIVIGADGAWSVVRKVLTSIEPFYTGITFFEGWIERPTEAQAALVGRGTMFAFGGPDAIFAQRNGEGRLCVYAAMKRSQAWLDEGRRKNPKAEVDEAYTSWASNLVDLLAACPDFRPRPIYSLPADADWPQRRGIYLVGDADHLMPPMGLGVNLAMLDAAELAIAIATQGDWRSEADNAALAIRKRGQSHIREAIPGFAEWFSGASPFLVVAKEG